MSDIEISDTSIAEMEPEPKKLVLGSGRPSKKSLADAQRQLNDDQLKLAVWLSFPEDQRRPRTAKDFAATLGVTETTIVRWKKIPDVIMATRWLQLQNAGDAGRVSSILDFLYNTAHDESLWMKDRLSAAKQWLQAVGVHEAWKYDNELLKVKSVDDFDLDSLSDEELWDLYATRSRALGISQDESGSDDEIVDGELA